MVEPIHVFNRVYWPESLVIDLRSEAEFRAGRIYGSFWLGPTFSEESLVPILDPEIPYVRKSEIALVVPENRLGDLPSEIQRFRGILASLKEKIRWRVRVFGLTGGFPAFRAGFPFLCVSTPPPQFEPADTLEDSHRAEKRSSSPPPPPPLLSGPSDDCVDAADSAEYPDAAVTIVAAAAAAAAVAQAPRPALLLPPTRLPRIFPHLITDYLALGSAACLSDPLVFEYLNIGLVVNCTMEIPFIPLEQCPSVEFVRFAMDDHVSQSIFPFVYEAHREIEKVRAAGKRVLVHCAAGISRSVTVVVAHLILANGMRVHLHSWVVSRRSRFDAGWDCDRALDWVQFCRPIACPNPGFVEQLREVTR
jgi:hypothetical protein